MTAEIKELPEKNVIAIEHIGDYMQIGEKFEKLLQWAKNNGIKENCEVLGVYYDDPEVKPLDELRSHACIAIGADKGIAEKAKQAPEIEIITIASGKYGVVNCEVKNDDFKSAWHSAFQLLQEKGVKDFLSKPCYEIYLNDARQDPENIWRIQICIPVA